MTQGRVQDLTIERLANIRRCEGPSTLLESASGYRRAVPVRGSGGRDDVTTPAPAGLLPQRDGADVQWSREWDNHRGGGGYCVVSSFRVIVSPSTWFVDRQGVQVFDYPGYRNDFLSVAKTHIEFLRIFFDGVPEPASEGPQVVLPVVESEEGVESETPERAEDPELFLHGPFSQRRCDLCHDAVTSNRLSMKRGELCLSCHNASDFAGKFVHGPAAAGLCLECHHPHQAPNRYLLVLAGSNLCAQCHDESTFAPIRRHRAEKGDDCTRCHDPHGSDQRYLLRGPSEDSL